MINIIINTDINAKIDQGAAATLEADQAADVQIQQ